MPITDLPTNDVAILLRILEREKLALSAAASRAILDFDFSEMNKAYMHELSCKAKDGILTSEEQEAALSYERIGLLLNVMHSKARRSLDRKSCNS